MQKMEKKEEVCYVPDIALNEFRVDSDRRTEQAKAVHQTKTFPHITN
jgi:hypothetical protein